MGFSRQEYWSGLPFPPPGDLPNLTSVLKLMGKKQAFTTDEGERERGKERREGGRAVGGWKGKGEEVKERRSKGRRVERRTMQDS